MSEIKPTMKTHKEVIEAAAKDARDEFGTAANLVQEFEEAVKEKWPPQGEPQNVPAGFDMQVVPATQENFYHREGVSDPNMLIACITRAASDPSVDPARMQQLMEIYERIAAKEAERQFNTAMRDAQNDMPKLVKDAKAPDYRYLTLEAIGRTIDPIARRHGFSTSYGTDDSPLDGHYRELLYLSHTGGHTRIYKLDLPADTTGPKGTRTKTGIQGIGSTMSYGRRYLKAMAFDLVIVGEDDDGNGGRDNNEPVYITYEQRGEIDNLLKEHGRSLERFLKFKRVSSLSEIKVKDLERTLAEIKAVAGRAGQ